MRCEAQSKQSGNRCKRSSIPGGTVCSMHGGTTPAVIAERSEMATMALKMGDLCQRVQFGTVDNPCPTNGKLPIAGSATGSSFTFLLEDGHLWRETG